MPLHDYECTKCGLFFNDVYQKYEDEPLTKCETCGAESLQKIFATPSFFVKGEATTWGQLADRNAKKMGKTQVEDKEGIRKEETKSAMKQAQKELYSNINKMGESQKRKYIDNG
jgi:putative FmdB family regulatory protein